MLKQKVVEFIRVVHIVSERVNTQSPEYVNIQNNMANLIERETKRIENNLLNVGSITTQYLMYLFNGLIPLFICYMNKFIANKGS